MVGFNGFSKYYNNNLIIKADAFTLEHGIYWLKGENGSGKTTLIKSIAGLIPFSGDITVNDINIRKERIAYRYIVNYAEAEPLYPSFLSGSDLIRFYTATKKADKQQVQTLIDALGIGSYIDNKIGTYSSGMAKKLSLALGFIGGAKLILLDEPLITIDQQAVSVLHALVEGYYKAGVSFLLTSHQEITLPHITTSRLAIVDKTLLKV